MLKIALKIYNRLLENGQIDSNTDSELFLSYKNPEIRQQLYDFEEELDFTLLEVGNTVYLIPCFENDILGYKSKEIRESIGSNANMLDAYLQAYIIMTILFMFYGGKNNNPIQREFIQTRDLVEELDKKFKGYIEDSEFTLKLEEGYSINFSKIAELWQGKQIGDALSRKSKLGTIQKAYSFLHKEHLINILNDNKEIRRNQKLDDIFLNYYLDENRIKDINEILQ